MDFFEKMVKDTNQALSAADQAIDDGLTPDQALHLALSVVGTAGAVSFLTRALIKNRAKRRTEIKWEIRKGSTREMNEKIESLLKQILEIEDLSDKRIQKLESCKYLLILDMGCGSTSAASLDLEKLKKGGQLKDCITLILWKYRVPNIRGGKDISLANYPSIPTLIGYSSFIPFIGPVALKTGNACENFKACPNDQNLGTPVLMITDPSGSVTKTLANVWSDYFRCIADNICSRCAKFPGSGPANRLNMAEDTLVMVAHPAGSEWSAPSVLKNFRALIAGGIELPDENVLTISEAKAAMQYVRRKYEQKLDFEKGVVIIDIGASTIDIEYLARGLPEPFENSLTMAGRDADALLLHYVIEQLYPAEMKKYTQPNQLPDDRFFIDRFALKSAMEKFNARLNKEELSNLAHSETYLSKSIIIGKEQIDITVDTLKGLLGSEAKDPLTGAVFGKRSFPTAYPADIAAYIHEVKGTQPDPLTPQQVEDTWYGHLENMVRYVMDTLAKQGRKVGQVIVTGGSCRLPDIEKHIWDAIQNSEMGSVFSNCKDIVCMSNENDYENAVPYGGGYYVGGILGKLDTLKNFPEKLYTKLYEELDGTATEVITDEVNTLVHDITLESLKWWRNLSNGDANCSTNKLNAHIKSECNRVFNQTNPNRLDKAIATAIGKLTPAKSLPQTMGEISNLLNTLAGAEFSGQVKIDMIKLDLPVNSISNAVRRVNPDTLTMGFWAEITGAAQNAVNGAANFFRDLFGFEKVEKNDLLRGDSYRNGVYEAYKENVTNAVDSGLKKDISDQLRKEFRKTNIFGIPDQIIDVLKQDIIHALYLN